MDPGGFPEIRQQAPERPPKPRALTSGTNSTVSKLGADTSGPAVAVAHKILVAVYYMLSHGVLQRTGGMRTWTNGTNNQLTRNLIHRLERLGYSVTLAQKAA